MTGRWPGRRHADRILRNGVRAEGIGILDRGFGRHLHWWGEVDIARATVRGEGMEE